MFFFINYWLLLKNKTVNDIEPGKPFMVNVNFVFQLLPLMSKLKLIDKFYHFLLEDHLENGYYRLSTYSKNEIIECIDRLKQ